MSNGERFVVLGEHFYQPSRLATHNRLADLHSDPEGVNWNSVVASECYIPQTQQGTLEHVSFDFYATIRREMLEIAPDEAVKLKEAMKKRGVGDPFLHVLLPDLTRRDKEVLVRAGYNAFSNETGVAPQWFWAPETALDYETLAVLTEVGYQGVLCAPEQIDGISEAADNKPIQISLPNGKNILALPFDRPFSQALAFANKSNADEYTYGTMIPRIDSLPETIPLVGWTDGETFGHHAKFADLFLHFLATESLPSAGVAVLGLNEIQDIWLPSDIRQGLLRPRSAWSCPHGDLIRWHGACPCDGGHHGGWKMHFSTAFQQLNQRVDQVLDSELGDGWVDRLTDSFVDAFYYQGSANSELSLLAAKASSLGAQISCGTFFESPNTSGRINVLFARQTIENLRDAGYGELSDQLLAELRANLAAGLDPFTNQSLETLFSDLL